MVTFRVDGLFEVVGVADSIHFSTVLVVQSWYPHHILGQSKFLLDCGDEVGLLFNNLAQDPCLKHVQFGSLRSLFVGISLEGDKFGFERGHFGPEVCYQRLMVLFETEELSLPIIAFLFHY
jgi:hypothetical protein